MTCHDSRLKEKSQVKWLLGGDHNSSYYHAIVKAKRVLTSISSLEIDGVLTMDADLIERYVIDRYFDLFNDKEVSVVLPDINYAIPHLVTHDDNDILTSVPDMVEIKATMFGMDSSSALGLDGFTGDFFTQCFEVVGSNVCEAMRYFFYFG